MIAALFAQKPDQIRTKLVKAHPESIKLLRKASAETKLPFMKGVDVLASDKPHGTRLKYLAGCKCFLCRRANSDYARERFEAIKNGNANGIVPAYRARAHLEMLSRLGVGRRSVSDVTDISQTIIAKIKSGARQNVRAQTESKILAVTEACIADRALVSAKPTWRLLNQMKQAGYTKTFIAQELGYARAIQFNKLWITVKNEQRVKALHSRLVGEGGLVNARVSANRIIRLLKEGYRVPELTSRLGFELSKLTSRIPSTKAKKIKQVYLDLIE